LYFKRLNRLFVIHPDLIPLCIPKAAAFLDACAHNYAHFITEVLPRINLFCSREEYADIPLIIDDQLHKNILEAIATIVGSSRRVYLLPIGRSIRCNTLLIISATGYVPFDQRNSRLRNTQQGQFSYKALKHLRENPALATSMPNNNSTHLEKIYVKRDSVVRRLINAEEVEDILRLHGFTSVDPGKLSFREQVSLFSHAKVIVGATGAAMANAVFCKPGTKIGILIAKHKHMIYKYWPAMLSPFKINVSYLLGAIVASHGRGIHGDFVVHESAIIDFLAECGSKQL
jgi:capsular polysaccharide biosynthesis protein